MMYITRTQGLINLVVSTSVADGLYCLYFVSTLNYIIPIKLIGNSAKLTGTMCLYFK